MTPRSSRGMWLVVAAISSAAVGCSSDTHPTAPRQLDTGPALAVAANFTRMGDSVVAAHGDTDAAIRFYGAAALLRRVPVFDTITITIDSVPMTFNAVALTVDDTDGPMACPMPPWDEDGDAEFECPWGIPRMTRTLFAWQPGNPPHVVELVAMADSSAIGAPGMRRGWGNAQSDSASSDSASADSASVDSAGARFVVPAHLKYFSGGHGIWWGVRGTQVSSVIPNGQPCHAADTTATDSTASPDRGGWESGEREGHGWGGRHINVVSCQMAEFSFAFVAVVGAPPVHWWTMNTGSGVHSISMPATKVPGAYVTLSLAHGDR